MHSCFCYIQIYSGLVYLRKLQHKIIPFQRDYEQLVDPFDLLQWYYPKSQHCFYGLAFLHPTKHSKVRVNGHGENIFQIFSKSYLTLDDPFTTNNVYNLSTEKIY